MLIRHIALVALLEALISIQNVAGEAVQCGRDPSIDRFLTGGGRASSAWGANPIVYLLGAHSDGLGTHLRVSITTYQVGSVEGDRIKITNTYYVNDQGWQRVNLPDAEYTALTTARNAVCCSEGAVSKASPEVLYQPQRFGHSDLRMSKDGGKTWKQMKILLGGSNEYSYAAVVGTGVRDKSRVYVSASMNGVPFHGFGLWVSDNYGETFRLLATGLRYVVEAPNNPQVLYAVSGIKSDHIVKSTDAGKHWRNLPASYVLSEPLYIDRVRDRITTLKDPAYEELMPTLDPIMQIEVDPSDADCLYVLTWMGLYRSSDGGTTFALLPFKDDMFMEIDTVAIDPIKAGRIYAGAGLSSIYVSEDKGCTWEKMRLPEK